VSKINRAILLQRFVFHEAVVTVQATFVDRNASTVTVAVGVELLLPRFRPLLESPGKIASAGTDVVRLPV
jgi:hypothetical protein